jgi:hypothetical protein
MCFNITKGSLTLVSVPLRGKDRKLRVKHAFNLCMLEVSVPLRGKDRKQQILVPMEVSKHLEFVSVPLRGKDRKLLKKTFRLLFDCFKRFRPLAGKR